jgi:hypothetical protein
MQFDPRVHTKAFLLGNKDNAFDLAKTSLEFALSPLANDIDLLLMADKYGETVAHRLAEHQSVWVKSVASQKLEILSAAKKNGRTVGHYLARYQHDWGKTAAAQKLEILSLADCNAETVAHIFAINQPEWSKSKASQNLEVLNLAKYDGWSVAHDLAVYQSEWPKSVAASNLDILAMNSNCGTVARMLVIHNPDCIHNKSLMQYQNIKVEHQGKLLAEEIVENYKSDGFDVSVMSMELIRNGAAYKQSKPIDIQDGEAILKQCKNLITDGLEPLISFKSLQAVYSTFAHNLSKINSTQEHESLHEWQDLLLISENLIRQHLNQNPDLYDMEHTVDILCEPGDDLLKKFQSERILASDLASLSGLNNTNCSEQEPKIQSLY